MRVLFSGYHNPHFMTVTEYMAAAIRALNHEVSVYDDGCHVVPGRLRRHIGWLDALDLGRINERLLTLASTFRPEVALITGGDRIRKSTVERLKSMGIVTVLWTVDVPHDMKAFGHFIDAGPAYDRIFCLGTEAVELFRQAGIRATRWLPVGCDPLHHHRVALSAAELGKYGSDVVFVGSNYPVRETLLEQMADLDLAVWGPGWDRVSPGSQLKCRVRAFHTRPEEWLKIYSGSKIVLAPHYRDPWGKIPSYQASPRIFEALACGAFVISDRQRDVLTLFREDEHLVFYDDPGDLREKIRFYLDHPRERTRIARSGMREALEQHTYLHRLRSLLSGIQGRDPSGDSTTGKTGLQ